MEFLDRVFSITSIVAVMLPAIFLIFFLSIKVSEWVSKKIESRLLTFGAFVVTFASSAKLVGLILARFADVVSKVNHV